MNQFDRWIQESGAICDARGFLVVRLNSLVALLAPPGAQSFAFVADTFLFCCSFPFVLGFLVVFRSSVR